MPGKLRAYLCVCPFIEWNAISRLGAKNKRDVRNEERMTMFLRISFEASNNKQQKTTQERESHSI